MARRGVAVSVLLMMILCVVHAHPSGRKVLQWQQGRTGGGYATAAQSQTEEDIMKAADNIDSSAVKATNPRTKNTPNPTQTSRGSIASGKQETQQGDAQAKIEGQAAAGKVARPTQNMPKGSDIPGVVAKTQQGTHSRDRGTYVVTQSNTEANIVNQVARQQAAAAANAQPGPNTPSGARPGL